ncbi:MAG: helix-turn-helix domain-containing protein, partial [Geminicoccaceae bacterium]
AFAIDRGEIRMSSAGSAPPGHPGWTELDRYAGGRMRERRILLGLTQRQLARLVGLSSDRVSRYESGGLRPLACRLHEIARVLDVDVAYFFEGWSTRPAARSRG